MESVLKELDTEYILQNYDNHKTLSEYIESFVSSDEIKLRKLLEKISFKDWIDVNPSNYDPNYECISYSEFSKNITFDFLSTNLNIPNNSNNRSIPHITPTLLFPLKLSHFYKIQRPFY